MVVSWEDSIRGRFIGVTERIVVVFIVVVIRISVFYDTSSFAVVALRAGQEASFSCAVAVWADVEGHGIVSGEVGEPVASLKIQPASDRSLRQAKHPHNELLGHSVLFSCVAKSIHFQILLVWIECFQRSHKQLRPIRASPNRLCVGCLQKRLDTGREFIIVQ